MAQPAWEETHTVARAGESIRTVSIWSVSWVWSSHLRVVSVVRMPLGDGRERLGEGGEDVVPELRGSVVAASSGRRWA